jgi:hypothetical protein
MKNLFQGFSDFEQKHWIKIVIPWNNEPNKTEKNRNINVEYLIRHSSTYKVDGCPWTWMGTAAFIQHHPAFGVCWYELGTHFRTLKLPACSRFVKNKKQ